MSSTFDLAGKSLQQLLQVMAMLRDPQHGCPWDLKQNLASLTRYTLEEVYEVVDAIENNATGQLRDELGDLLFQIIFYARIAEENGLFDFAGVSNAITDKLIRRHPHVFPEGKLENFGQEQQLSAEDVVVKWEAIKQAERQSTAGEPGQSDKSGLLADIPSALPAMERALKIQRRVARVGFDWSSLDPVLAKVQEELQELQQAIGNEDKAAMNEELGDLLFAVVNLARHLDVEPESALRATNRKFVDRFGFMEQALRDEGKQLGELSLDQLDHYWELAKQAER